MAIYICNGCDVWFDDDYYPGCEDLTDTCALLCEPCALEQEEFLRGWEDCEKNRPPGENESEDYLKGYGDCYAYEQDMNAMSDRRDNVNK